jgi:putative ABC transport system permease protein
MTGFVQDLKYALRSLRKSPGFTAVAVATLALGIGANTAIFSVVRGLLLRPLSFSHPDRIVGIWEKDADRKRSTLGWPTFTDFRDRSRSFDAMAAVSYWTPILTGRDDAIQVEGLRVSREFLRVLGVKPEWGRDFRPDEDRPDHNHVVILGYGLFQRRFGGNPAVVGKTIQMGDTPYLVAGVLPRRFESVFSTNSRESAEIFAPLGYDESLSWACRTCRHLRVFGRLKRGVSAGQVQAELDSLSAAIVRQHPKDYPAAGSFVVPLRRQLYGDSRPALLAVLGAVGLVLLMACANVGSLFLARLAERNREIGIRASLGASSPRLVRMVLTEGVVLGIAGGAAGLAAAEIIQRALLAAAPVSLPRLTDVRMDGTVLAAGAALSLLVGIALGLGAGRRAVRAALENHGAFVRGASAGRPFRRSVATLIIADAALAFVLLLGAGLLVRSVVGLLNVSPGFEPSGLLRLEIHTAGSRFRSDENLWSFYRSVLGRAREIPGVESAALASQVPLGGNFDGVGVHLADRPNANPELDPSAQRYAVSPGFLHTMGIPVRLGRAFTPDDRKGAPPVILLNESFARKLWPGENPLGKRVKLGGLDGPWRTVVGLVGNVRHTGLDDSDLAAAYVPEEQWSWADDMVLLLRTSARPERFASAAVAAVRSVDPHQVVNHIDAMESVAADSAARRRFARNVLGALAAMALLLASLGIYGVVARSVEQRRREFGIRLALGSTSAELARLVAASNLLSVAIGIGLGAAGGIALSRYLSSLLYGVGPHDPASFAAAAALLLLVASAAAFRPTLKAARIDPAETLRAEG